MDKTGQLKELLNKSGNIVFFGGAGVSTRSGIPDFRSADGLYKQKYAYPPETILSSDFFYSNTKEFYRFYFDKMIYAQAKPNPAHYALAKLEEQGRLKAIVTQNIDNLHQLAGSKTVYELHGSVYRNYCMKCGKAFDLNYMIEHKNDIVRCDECNGTVKPDVVLYGEGLNEETVENSVEAIEKSDILIVGGTSLNVYPAAGLIRYYRGNRLVLINKSKTSFDSYANLVITDDIAEVLSAAVDGE